MFQFSGSPHIYLFYSVYVVAVLPQRVSPFGNPRIYAHLQLPVAYRSLSRPSSAPDAKAFPLRSFQLDLVGAKSARRRFRRWPMAPGENCARSLAPPLPRGPASLGSARLFEALRFGSLKNYAGIFTEVS